MVLAEVEDAEDGLVALERMKAAMRVEDSIASLAKRARASATLLASTIFALASSSRARWWATRAAYSSAISAAMLKRAVSFSRQQGGSWAENIRLPQSSVMTLLPGLKVPQQQQ